MARLPFVDTHIHFSDMQNPDLRYVWLEPGWKHPILGDIEGIQAQRYWADEYVAETRFAKLRARNATATREMPTTRAKSPNIHIMVTMPATGRVRTSTGPARLTRTGT